MPYQHVVDHARKLVTVTAVGHCDLAFSLSAMHEIQSACSTLEGYALLHDFRQLVYVPSFSDVREIADVFASLAFLRQHPAAFVFGGTMVYGIGMIFCAIANSQGAHTKAFREIESAQAWLALPELTRTNH